MPRFKLTIEYAGTRYSGWQIQKNARTVQGELVREVRDLTGRSDCELYGSGRSDAGVHALAQVAHLDVSTPLSADLLRRRLNDDLPGDINILAATQVPHRFHARHDAVARRYVYQVSRRRTAFAKPYVWWVKDPLDVERMQQAAAAFVGFHDFSSFAASDSGDEAPSRVLIDRLDVVQSGALVLFVVEGSHFLWRMVRRLVGVLVSIGRGELDARAAQEYLVKPSAVPARLTAPASGLFLARVFYPGEPRDPAVQPATPIE